ncbi:MAG: response regulator [Deltaproteobacteria bacterium]|nr:response regulator [Deltaproteobacteria bacterium]
MKLTLSGAVNRWFQGYAAAPGHVDELRELGPTMIRTAAILSILAFGGMATVDHLMVDGEALTLTRLTRVVSCALFLAFAGASYFGSWAKRFARPATVVLCLICGASVITLAHFTGNTASTYHDALLVVYFGFAVMPLAWGPFDALAQYLALIAAYDAVIILTEPAFHPGHFATHNAVLVAAFLVATVLQRILAHQRLIEYQSRSALAVANERLTALDQAKTRFFSNISHELRTPLTLIVAPLEALLESKREPLSMGQRERLELAQRNALRLLRLVDDILSLTRAEAASLKIHVTRLDLGELVAAFAADVNELAARKNITLTVKVPEPGLAMVDGDQTMIERVLLNVFGNAAKFVKIGGRIELVVREANVGQPGWGWEIAVIDNGIGISAGSLPHIFDRFYQADSSSTRSTGGTGIGLALVKEIVELHGGRVGAESVHGEGTTILARFPSTLPPECEANAIRQTAPKAEPQGLPEWHQAIRNARSYRLQGIDEATERRVAPRPRHRGDAPTILVVEDNPDMIRFLVALMAYDYNVLSAQNGRDGLKMALDRRPDLIISDVMMPEMDGFEMVRRIREDAEGAKIPLIFLTARGSHEDRIQGHAGGADTYLSKPFHSEELLAAVDALLARQQTLRAAATSQEEEAVVFMATGVVEQLSRSVSRLKDIQSEIGRVEADPMTLLGRFAEGLASLVDLVGALRELAEAGVKPLRAMGCIDDELRAVAVRATELSGHGRSMRIELGAVGQVAVEPDELRAILEPLVMRALEVTPPGRDASVQSQGASAGSGDGVASIVIVDQGPTLSHGQIERFFFPFQGGDGDARRALELARARRLVLARGGTVTVESGGVIGARVTVRLPTLASGAPALPPARSGSGIAGVAA